MPLQNRVTPFGEIVAVAERGTMMGNRGILHDAAGRLRRRWAGRLWICCVLEFRGRREPVMAPGHYTRLFFLDEPTALAAGHRPCACCRRSAYLAFRSAWAAGNAELGLGPTPRAVEIDRVLQAERVGPGGSKRLRRAQLDELPDGTFVTFDVDTSLVGDAAVTRAGDDVWVRPSGSGEAGHGLEAYLTWRGAVWRWTPGGYQACSPHPPGPLLTLTPPSIVSALARGYTPEPPAGLGVAGGERIESAGVRALGLR
jgi:hypothetical protein